MARIKSTWQFVNIHGKPIKGLGWDETQAEPVQPIQKTQPTQPVQPARHAAPPRQLTPADVQAVFDAMCLAGWRRGRSELVPLLAGLGWRLRSGQAFTAADVGRSIDQLVGSGLLELNEQEAWVPTLAARRQRMPDLLARPESVTWWRVWVWAANGGYGAMVTEDRPPSHCTTRNPTEAASLALLFLASGADAALFGRLRHGVLAPVVGRPMVAALAELLALRQLQRVHASLLWPQLVVLEQAGLMDDEPSLLAWLDEQVDRAPALVPPLVRVAVADRRLHTGRGDAMRRALLPDDESAVQLASFAPAYDAALLALQGRFVEAAAAFAPALKQLGSVQGRRRQLLPPRTLQLYPLSLMSQHDAQAWTTARKFCVGESGSRQPSTGSAWGRWAHATAVRLGDAQVEPTAFAAPWHNSVAGVGWSAPEADAVASSLVLAAWLDHEPKGWTAPRLQALSDQLHQQGLAWKADLFLQACIRLELPVPQRPAHAPPPWPVAFYPPPKDIWRDALSAIVALGDLGGASGASGPAVVPVLIWRLSLDEEGRPSNLEALEPSVTGRARAKTLSPGQLKKRTRMDARDAAVARSIRQSSYRVREMAYDLTQAVQALVGHPALELADAPGVQVDLREGLPILEVQRQRSPGATGAAALEPQGTEEAAECFVFRLHDVLLPDLPPSLDHQLLYDDDEQTEEDKRNSMRVLRDAPDRARLIRITPAQRRVAELVSKRWTVPVQAQGELDAALRVLSGHFVLHSDAEAGDPVPADGRLVVQLQPRGDALQLQVAVRPFGDFGPMLPPGAGRQRLMTLHGGVSLSTLRSLDEEQGRLQSLLEALPMLGEAPPDASWLLIDPEDALAAVHHLAALSQGEDAPVRAVEWPKGKPLRVITPETRALQLRLKTQRDWLGLEGELQIDEGRVLSLQQVLGLLRDSRGQRFVALGQGEYLALADHLRQRLADLDALADSGAGGAGGEAAVRLGHTAAAWLADAADDLGLQGDPAWRERAQRLEEAAALDLGVPPGLQAQLRPYQADGWLWMARLAHAGFGACLADDMGLGKTVQTLALLLHRAADGPALVVAPTSVCANWLAEARRFAPGLRVALYGVDGERAEQLAQATAGDVLIVSYALLVGECEAFAQREWATLVLDEAQALKNAATQRVKAVGTLQATFRLALSGTPVENRLADLWSIMNLLNPGLLGNANRFAERFANPIERQRNDGARARLRRLVSPFLLRRTKAQVLTDLPPRTEIIHRVEPAPEERAFLEAMRREAVARVTALDPNDGRSAFNVLAELTRLRRAACDPRLAAPELGFIGAKVQAFERMALELVEGRHQALVFSQFTDFLKLLAQRLDAAGLRYQYLDGSTPAAVRAERVAAFQRGEGDLFLISLKAGGFGLNLTAADYVIIADPWWNPAAEDQAMGRAHRIGQLRPVTVYRLVTAGSIEERIVALHHDKRELADGLLSDQDSSVVPRAEDLMALLIE